MISSIPKPRCRADKYLLAVALMFTTVSGICQGQIVWPLWESYTRAAIDQQGRVIDHSAQDHTTSEGQSYAMFFALVANDRVRFEKLLRWSEINLANGNLAQQLPAWAWGKAPD